MTSLERLREFDKINNVHGRSLHLPLEAVIAAQKGEIRCPDCGSGWMSKMPDSFRIPDYNQCMVECMNCHRTPTKSRVEAFCGRKDIQWA